jgi:hypothetical protein
MPDRAHEPRTQAAVVRVERREPLHARGSARQFDARSGSHVDHGATASKIPLNLTPSFNANRYS